MSVMEQDMENRDRDSFRRNRRPRNRALLWVLLGLAVLFYAITIVKMG
ncbi:hypothetical protein [Oceanibaculum nanhaiense]|mgnify:CR=1 FL=1|nr:hypothetical protein [Oceanibaculum nanhaiense]MBC7137028.1 hypothetical protein [Oceanibaculum nanhaiense]MDM7944989.1 hypothetical protein [Oceanibaculum nanhaiense]